MEVLNVSKIFNSMWSCKLEMMDYIIQCKETDLWNCKIDTESQYRLLYYWLLCEVFRSCFFFTYLRYYASHRQLISRHNNNGKINELEREKMPQQRTTTIFWWRPKKAAQRGEKMSLFEVGMVDLVSFSPMCITFKRLFSIQLSLCNYEVSIFNACPLYSSDMQLFICICIVKWT